MPDKQESTDETWAAAHTAMGGWPGCLLMIVFSVGVSVVLTVLVNLLL